MCKKIICLCIPPCGCGVYDPKKCSVPYMISPNSTCRPVSLGRVAFSQQFVGDLGCWRLRLGLHIALCTGAPPVACHGRSWDSQPRNPTRSHPFHAEKWFQNARNDVKRYLYLICVVFFFFFFSTVLPADLITWQDEHALSLLKKMKKDLYH